ncbi:MAG: phenylphosphate carboxylase subunit gamma [Chloroflexi bacterium]|nr:phenylphosphate carboxylase subunit gamma [Chloroflexota bacterium]
MNLWEVYVNSLADLPQDVELTLSIRTLNEGKYKYTYSRVAAKVSPDLDRYPDRLQVRFGRGQLSDKKFSIEILGEKQIVPEKYAWGEADIEFLARSM